MNERHGTVGPVEVKVCTDCLVYVANGELPDDAARRYDITKGEEVLTEGFRWVLTKGFRWVLAPGDESTAFSKQSCDCCRTTLAGERHQAWLVARRSVTA